MNDLFEYCHRETNRKFYNNLQTDVIEKLNASIHIASLNTNDEKLCQILGILIFLFLLFFSR